LFKILIFGSNLVPPHFLLRTKVLYLLVEAVYGVVKCEEDELRDVLGGIAAGDGSASAVAVRQTTVGGIAFLGGLSCGGQGEADQQTEAEERRQHLKKDTCSSLKLTSLRGFAARRFLRGLRLVSR